MADTGSVCVLIPTLNESETIGEVVSEFSDRGFLNILVMDGGSTDGTRERAEAAGARVVEQSGTGKGQAVREAVAEHVDADYVLLLDGDGTYCASDAVAMLEPLDDGYEHVIGNRFADMRSGAMTRLNRLGNRLINHAFAAIHGENYRDILSGYRAFTTESFRQMTLTSEGFGIETEMAVECIKRDVPTGVVPVTYLPRPVGSNTNLRPLRDGGIIFLEIYRRAKTNNPLFYFGSVGTAATSLGVLLATYVGVEWVTRRVSHEVIAVIAAFGILFGVQLLIFGVLSDLILKLHQEQMQEIRRLDDEIERDASDPGVRSIVENGREWTVGRDED